MVEFRMFILVHTIPILEFITRLKGRPMLDDLMFADSHQNFLLCCCIAVKVDKLRDREKERDLD